VSLKTTYKCADGRDFPVEWEDPEQATQTWYWDSEHNPSPMAPLDFAVWQGPRAGGLRARREAGFPEWSFFGSYIRANGFAFYGEHSMPPSVAEAHQKAAADARERYGSQLHFWQEYCIPRIEAACARLRAASAEEPLSEILEEFSYGFEHTFIFIAEDASNLRKFFAEAFGQEGERLAVELTQGFPSATMEGDQALWEVAQMARRSPALERAILNLEQGAGPEALRHVEGGAAFLEAFRAYLDRYGWRTQDWDVSSPTWLERPEVPLALVRRTLAQDLPPPTESVQEAARRRQVALAEAERRLAGDPGKLQEFRKLSASMPEYLAVKEGRALLQLTMNGVLHHAILKKGALLAAAGRVTRPDDVFYLALDEIAAGEGDVSAEVKVRRAERERWMGVVPPAKIGGFGKEDSAAEAESEPLSTEFRGIAASRGVLTATARVLVSIDEFGKLGPGEVLVCASTTPTWTPLFGIAGALVTDGGGLLSHPAIAAREYAIPAVVGTRVATQVIRDGMLVTVDGTAGVVRIEG
jgi:rifampicin phosphotransferase